MNYSFKEKRFLIKPFPILFIKNFINKKKKINIINEISNIEKKTSVKKVMGGRYQYSKILFKKNDTCSEIYNYFNQKKTFEKIFKHIYDDSNQFLIKKDQFNNFVKKRNILHKMINKFFPKLLKNSFFLDMDFSVAKNNYCREPHHDRDTRILSFLIYLNTTKNSNGGRLEIYEYKKNSNHHFERFPKKKNLNLYNMIKPEFGKFIAFFSSPDSIHGVEKFISKNNEKRIFLYGSYTTFKKVDWKKT
jgi:hypothetical protein